MSLYLAQQYVNQFKKITRLTLFLKTSRCTTTIIKRMSSASVSLLLRGYYQDRVHALLILISNNAIIMSVDYELTTKLTSFSTSCAVVANNE